MSLQDRALIIGAMKSGTTSLFHRLCEHPAIHGANKKEPGFFARDEVWARGLDWYLDLWDPPQPEHEVALEASINFTVLPRFPQTVPRLKQVAEEHGFRFKFIYSLRDPLARIKSQLTHMRAGSAYDHIPPALERGDIDGFSLEVSLHARQLDPYLEHFGPEDLHLVRFEEFVSDPVPVLDGITRFLDLAPHDFSARDKVHNPSIGKYEKGALWRAMERTGLVGLKRVAPDGVVRGLREALGDRLDEKVELTRGQEEMLLYLLAPDLRRLRDEVGFDVEPWPTWQLIQERGF